VYWGIACPRQHQYLADLLGAGHVVVENRTFSFSWNKARAAVDARLAPVIGPLDMFHLPFYEELYRRRHIPIHYLLLVGYDDENAYVHDTGHDQVQALPLDELQGAWDVNVPGLGKRNRLVTFDLPQDLPPTGELVRRSIADQCQTMLNPPVSMVGIPAMNKVAREIARWPQELGAETASACLRQVLEYLNSPPDLEGDHLTAGRDRYISFLQEAGSMAGLDLSSAISRLQETLEFIPCLAGAIRQGQLEQAAGTMQRIADGEQTAFTELRDLLTLPQG